MKLSRVKMNREEINKKDITNIDSLELFIRRLGFENIVRDTQTRLIVYMESSERRSSLKSIAESLDGKYVTGGPGWKSSAGGVTFKNFTVLAKPQAVKGVSASLSELDVRKFAKLGTAEKFNYAGENIDCVSFSSAKAIKDSILKGVLETSILGESVADSFNTFFDTGSFVWDPEISNRRLNNIGVYAGEILVGWVALSGKQSLYFDKNPFKGTPKKFYIPTDPKFSGVDSFIEMQDGTYYAVSSKFGRGAKASFFSNLLSYGMKNRSNLQKSTFTDIIDVAIAGGLKSTDSRKIVYLYGINNILKLKTNIYNPERIYWAIVYESESKKKLDFQKLNDVIDAIKEKEPKIQGLPNSVSNFFNRTIANSLNSDQKSLEQISNILVGKDFWQANLDVNEWSKGNLKFKWLRSGSATVKFIGNKSAASDPTCRQGWVNYELKY